MGSVQGVEFTPGVGEDMEIPTADVCRRCEVTVFDHRFDGMVDGIEFTVSQDGSIVDFGLEVEVLEGAGADAQATVKVLARRRA